MTFFLVLPSTRPDLIAYARTSFPKGGGVEVVVQDAEPRPTIAVREEMIEAMERRKLCAAPREERSVYSPDNPANIRRFQRR